MRFILLCFLTLASFTSWAGPVNITSLGVSPKGQYVAIEEYGYNPGLRTYYSRIRLLNLWKNTEAAPMVEVEHTARSPEDLLRAREEARSKATASMEKLNIVTSG